MEATTAEGPPSTGSRDIRTGPARTARLRPRAWSRRDAVGLGAVAVVAVMLLVPALLRGPFLGPYGLLAQHGLLRRVGVAAPPSGGDLVTEMIPWTVLNWTQVHAGHLPLWNPFSGFGLPEAFNWQSAPFSLPSVVGYLLPLSLAFTGGVLVSTLVAGTGMYVLGRALGLGTAGCIAAGVLFEVSGPLVGWWGYPLGAVVTWAGWIFAGVVLVVDARRSGGVVLLAVSLALSVYAGNPESLIVLLPLLALFALVLVAARLRSSGPGEAIRAVARLGGAGIAGAALAAPLLLPGAQLTSGIERLSRGGGALAPSLVSYLGVPGVEGKGALVGLAANVQAYLGVVVIALCVVAVAARWRRVPVAALALVGVVSVALVFVPGVAGAASHLPLLSTVYWTRVLLPLAFAVAALAGVGVDVLCRHQDRRLVARSLTGALVALGASVLAVRVTDALYRSRPEEPIQPTAFTWPVVSLLAGVVAAAMLWWEVRRSGSGPAHVRPLGASAMLAARARRTFARSPGVAAALVLVASGTVSLLAVGAPELSSGPSFVPSTPGVSALARVVGTSTVGFGPGGCAFGAATVGVPAEANVLYGIHEVALYDPIVPEAYFTAWREATGQVGGVPAFASFCPTVTTVAQARRFGIGYVLEAPGAPGPRGGTYVGTFAGEGLYRVPGAGAAVLVAAPTQGQPAAGASGRPVPVSTPNPSTWRVVTDAPGPTVLRLHLTDVPGWRATVDGAPLALRRWSGLMLEARIPAGHHVVVVTYWPRAFTEGLVAAALAAACLVASVVIDGTRRRGRRRRTEVIAGP